MSTAGGRGGRTVTVFEHQELAIGPVGSAGTLTPAEADALDRIGMSYPDFCSRRHRSVRFTQHCGVVRIGDRVLEILPKVDDAGGPSDGRMLLLRMLQLAPEHGPFRQLHASHTVDRAPLLELFIGAFMASIAAIARGGLLRKYEAAEEDLLVVRGRMVESRQFTALMNRPDRVACRFDEHTPDNRWNRVLKAALRLTRAWIHSGTLHRRWIELMAVFEEVGPSTDPLGDCRGLVSDRQGARYDDALAWAEWILRLLSPTFRAGTSEAPSLLFDMNRLFEASVASLLRKRLRGIPGVRVIVQDKRARLARLAEEDGRPVFQLRPDLVVERDGRVILVADTKWKRFKELPEGRLQPSPGDAYQMLAYASRYEAAPFVLIYPWHSSLAGTRESTYALPRQGDRDPRLAVACVDLADPRTPFLRGGSALEQALGVAV